MSIYHVQKAYLHLQLPGDPDPDPYQIPISNRSLPLPVSDLSTTRFGLNRQMCTSTGFKIAVQTRSGIVISSMIPASSLPLASTSLLSQNEKSISG